MNCRDCEKEINEGQGVEIEEGVFICEECAEKYFYCPYCDEYHLESDGGQEVVVNSDRNSEFFCRTCVDNDTQECDDCGDLIIINDGQQVLDRFVCNTCAQQNYIECDECGHLYSRDFENENGGVGVCPDCFDPADYEYINIIHPYDYKPQFKFYGDAPNNRYFGLEIEMQMHNCNNDTEIKKQAYKLSNINDTIHERGYWSSDGSISEDYDGAEFITHPHTIEELAWLEEFTENAISDKCRSHNTNTCGLHCHVSRNSLGVDRDDIAETVANMIIFFDNNWEDIVKFSRRKSGEISDWCNNNMNIIENEEDISRYKTKKECVKKYTERSDYRYQAINVQNKKTVEIRIFKGTLKYSTIIASVQFVDLVCEVSHQNTDIESYTFDNLVALAKEKEYNEFIDYCIERKIIVEDKEEDIKEEEKKEGM